VNADLVRVWQTEPGQIEKLTTADFALSLPAGWLSYQPKPQDDPQDAQVSLLDPRADTRSQVNARPKSSLPEGPQSSPVKWTEDYLGGDVKKMYADFAVDESGIVEMKIGGQPAARIVADFTEDGKKYRMLGIAVIGEKKAAVMRFISEADKFDSLRKDYDAIVESFRFE
jgi:hypothetical protein